MKILFRQNCIVAGEHCAAGGEKDIPDAVAAQMIAIGRAVPAAAALVAETRDRSVGLTTSDAPALMRRLRGRKDGG